MAVDEDQAADAISLVALAVIDLAADPEQAPILRTRMIDRVLGPTGSR